MAHKIEFTNKQGRKQMLFLSYFNKHKNEKWFANQSWYITDPAYLMEQKVAEKNKTAPVVVPVVKTEKPEVKSDIPDFTALSVKKIKSFIEDKYPELNEQDYKYLNKENLITYAQNNCK